MTFDNKINTTNFQYGNCVDIKDNTNVNQTYKAIYFKLILFPKSVKDLGTCSLMLSFYGSNILQHFGTSKRENLPANHKPQ